MSKEPGENKNQDKNGRFRAYIAELSDIDALVNLERESGSEDVWSYDQFESILKNRKIKIAMVNQEEKPTAYMAFEIKRREVVIWSLTVKKKDRRRGIGSGLVEWLKSTFREVLRASRITCVVRESDLASQLFFRYNGFICTKILDDVFECPPENGFFFNHEIPGQNNQR